MQIDARKFWQKVGTPICHGDEVEIACGSGTWTVDKRTSDWLYTDVNGIPVQGTPRQEESHLLPTANGGALIGRLGWRGEIFLVKCSDVFKAEADGPLLLIMNDSEGSVRKDNDGIIPITVIVRRAS